MKEIKFRAWGIKKNKYLKLHSIHLSTSKVIVSYYGVGGGNISIALKDIILEQYTGLKDKNGKEIYEGDIVKVEAFGRVYQVVYRKWDCSFVFENDEDEDIASIFEGFPDKYEVIGNIHENQELLD